MGLLVQKAGVLLACSFLPHFAPARAASLNELVNGDLSDNRLAPTVLMLSHGENAVTGQFGLSPVPNVADLDYLTVIVAPTDRLSALVLTSLNPGGANSFLGVQAGPVMTLPPGSFDPSPLLGWAHVFQNQTGSDLLPALGIAGGLGPGSYTFWINETDVSSVWSYGLDFTVTQAPVPLPPALGLFASAIATAAMFRRRPAAGNPP